MLSSRFVSGWWRGLHFVRLGSVLRVSDPRARPAALCAALATTGCFAAQPLPEDPRGTEGTDTTTLAEETTSSSATSSPSTTESGQTQSISTTSATASTEASGEQTTSSASTSTDQVCGDGRVDGDEVCDDGDNDGGYDGCSADCAGFGPFCGDGRTQADEACDDGNEVSGDGCNPNCAVSGDVVWEDVFSSVGSVSSDFALEVKRLADGQVLAAVSSSPRSDEFAVLIRRYSADGRLVSSVPVAGLDSGRVASRASVGEDGGYALVQAALFSESVLYSYDAEHKQLWSRTFEDASDLEVAVMPSGHVFYGESNLFDAGVVGRIASTGNTVWQDIIVPGGDSHTYSTARAPNGDLFASGYHIPSGAALVQSRTPTGAEVSTTDVGPIPTDITISADTDDGGAICWGDEDTTGLVRFGSDGTVHWTAEHITVGGTLARCRDLVVLAGGDVVTIGDRYREGMQDILVVRFSERSGVRWSRTFAGTKEDGFDLGWAIDELQDGRLVVGGRVQNTETESDAWVASLEP